MANTDLRIAIIGAGPVGLTLAAILHHRSIQCTVFERDTSATSRDQGGTLDIHEDSGQRAIVAAGLMAEFKKVSRPEADVACIIKKDGTVLLDENEPATREWGEEQQANEGADNDQGRRGRPEIDRQVLKDLLLNSLPEGTVRWGKGISAVSPVPGTEQWTLAFLDGDASSSRGPYDLVVGADGAWSRVRPALTDVRPQYSGVTALDARISAQALAARPAVARFVGRGSVYVCAAGRWIALQRHGDGSARCYACVRVAEAPGGPVPVADPATGALVLPEPVEGAKDAAAAATLDWTEPGARTAFLDRHLAGFAPEIRGAVGAMTEQPLLRHMHMLPVGHTWAPRAGVTLAGDAAHVMTPFAGVGVNVGMVDAAELAAGIARHAEKRGEKEGGLAGVLRAYEEAMFARSARDAAFTYRMLEVQFRDDGAEKVVGIMTGQEPHF
ncbi:FAD/NAD(P)-binding domain-containing protein [Hypoxylon sp. FL1284]|nr:FAD/NAD(P)-binding domain-containing protein [Hypoxylon sp. FL1284]